MRNSLAALCGTLLVLSMSVANAAGLQGDYEVSAAAVSHGAHAMPHAPRASFWAAGLANIVTRPLDENDHFRGNEVVAYAPLSQGVKVLPAYTLGHEFKGDGLDARWNDPNCRSSFVGHFSL